MRLGLAIKLRPKSSGGKVLIKDSKSQSQSNTDRLAGRADEDDLYNQDGGKLPMSVSHGNLHDRFSHLETED